MSEFSELLKQSKVTPKMVAELLYTKNPTLARELINEIIENKVTKSLSQQEKDARTKARNDKKAHRDKFVRDSGGLDKVTGDQVKEEMRKYDKAKRTKPKANPASEDEHGEKPKADEHVEPKADSEPEDDKSISSNSETETEETPKAKTKANPKAKPKADSEPEDDKSISSNSETETEETPKAKTKANPKAKPKADSEPEDDKSISSNSESETEETPKTKPKAKPKAKEDKSKAKPKASQLDELKPEHYEPKQNKKGKRNVVKNPETSSDGD